MSPDGVAHSPRHRAWADVDDALWNDWRWQLRNRVTTLEQLESLIDVTDAERVGGRPEDPARDRIVGCVKAVHGARLGSGLDCVDHDCRARSLPGVEEPRRLLLARNDSHAERHPIAHACGDGQTGAVVTAVGVADGYHDAPVTRHRRWTSSVRKCVAHEMQGS